MPEKNTSGLKGAGIGVLTWAYPISLLGLAAGIWIIAGEEILTHGFEFDFSSDWRPSSQNFGFAALIVNTVLVAIPASLVSIFFGTIVALNLSYFSDSVGATVGRITLAIWSVIPSIVIGLSVMAALVPITGFSFTTAAIAIFCMVTPGYTMNAIAVFKQLPPGTLLTARAVGMSDFHISTKVVLALSKRLLISLSWLTFSRALGEATAVSIVAGGVVRGLIPMPLEGIETLSAAILKGYPTSTGNYTAAILVCAALLMLLVSISSAIGTIIKSRYGNDIKTKG